MELQWTSRLKILIMNISRRKFIGLSICGGIFTFYKDFAFANSILKNQKKPVLILIELRGGNDGLNTIIPYSNPIYFSKRPNISIKNFLKLNSNLALNPSLKDLLPLWNSKELTFALGIGWSQPNRSHFKAMDQWSTGNIDGTGKGWIAKISDSIKNKNYLLSLGPTSSIALEGGNSNSLHFIGNEQKIIQELNYQESALLKDRETLRNFIEIEKFSTNEILKIKNKIRKLPTNIQIPKGSLSKQTSLALKLINTESPPTFMHLEQGGYDTHQNQLMRQNKKLSELGSTIYALKKGAEKLNKDIDLNIVVTSEFGRRLKENGTKGTDHGSASVAILVGNSFKHQFLGTYPDLDNLDNRGDLIPNISPSFFYEYAQKKIWS